MNNNSDNYDINFELKIKYYEGTLPLEYLVDISNAINDAIYWSEVKDIRDFRKEFPELPRVVFDAAEFRVSDYRRSSLRISSLSKGSIILTGAAAGLAFWILQQTIGETLKEAWLETGMHRKLKNFLLSRRSKKVEDIAFDSKKRIVKSISPDTNIGYDHPVCSKSTDCSNIRIEVVIRDQRKTPPVLSKLLHDDEE